MNDNLSLSVPPEPEDHEPWEQLPGEPDTAYHAFTIFRGMGRQRKVKTTVKQYNTTAQQPIIEATAFVWQADYNWKERVKAWDKSLDKEVADKQAAAITEMNTRQATQARLMSYLGSLGIRRWIERAKEDPSILDKINTQTLATYIAEGQRLERVALAGGEKHPLDIKPSFVIMIHNPNLSQPTVSISQTDNPSLPAPTVDIIEGEVRELLDATKEQE